MGDLVLCMVGLLVGPSADLILCGPTGGRGSQVLCSWQYWQHMATQVPPTKRLLRVALDETSVAYFDTKKTIGNVFVGRRKKELARTLARGRATLRDLRIHLTHVAVVCDDVEIQPLLPQILVIAATVLPKGLVDAISALLPANVEVWRAKSGWVNGPIFCKIIERIAETLAPFRETRQCILMLDCLAAHYTSPVLRAAWAGGLWVTFVPANLTWLLQVLDTHCFSRYKEYLRDIFSRARASTPNGIVPIVSWISLICDTIRGVLEATEWGPAFDANGFSPSVAGVRQRIWDHIGDPIVAVCAGRPTVEQLRLVFPGGKRPLPLLAELFPPPAPPGGAALAAPVRRLRRKTFGC